MGQNMSEISLLMSESWHVCVGGDGVIGSGERKGKKNSTGHLNLLLVFFFGAKKTLILNSLHFCETVVCLSVRVNQ